jgi:hypothetical protein
LCLPKIFDLAGSCPRTLPRETDLRRDMDGNSLEARQFFVFISFPTNHSSDETSEDGRLDSDLSAVHCPFTGIFSVIDSRLKVAQGCPKCHNDWEVCLNQSSVHERLA